MSNYLVNFEAEASLGRCRVKRAIGGVAVEIPIVMGELLESFWIFILDFYY
jgi:hypothetical protein